MKRKKRLDKYLTGGDIPTSDYGLGTVLALSAGAVAQAIETAKMDTTPYHLNQNKFQSGGMVEVEGNEMYETPDGRVGKFKGPSHENGGIPADLEEGTRIYSKRLKGADGKSFAERKERRTKQLDKLMKKFEKTPEDQLLKSTLERTAVTNMIEDTHDTAIMEATRQFDQMVATMMQGGVVKKYAKGGTVDPEDPKKPKKAKYMDFWGAELSPPAGSRQEAVMKAAYEDAKRYGSTPEEVAKTINMNISQYSLQKARLLAETPNKVENWESRISDFNAGKGDINPYMAKAAALQRLAKESNVDYYGVETTPFDLSKHPARINKITNTPKKYAPGGITGDPEPDYNQRLAMFRWMRDNPGKPFPGQAEGIGPQEPVDTGPQSIPLTVKPEIPTVTGNWGTGPNTIKQPEGWPAVPGDMSKDGKNLIPNKDGKLSNFPGMATGTEPVDEEVSQFTTGDRLGFAGTGVSAFGPGIMTALNRIGDKRTPNFMQGFGEEGLRTQQAGIQQLQAMLDQAIMQGNLSANQARQGASGNIRNVSQLQSNLSGIDAQQQTQTGRTSAQFAEAKVGQLGRLGATQMEVDKMRRIGEQQAFELNQADRDNFFTQLNQDIVNMGTGIQKSGADLNAKEYNKDILSLLPELSSYGIGIKKKKGGGYELYETT